MTNNIIELENGLRVCVDEMKDVETASIAVFVGTGSANETKSNNGISHFLEHMAFKGTKTRSSKQIAEDFENIGGVINAYTSKEKTVYYVKVLKKYAEFAIEFLADILQNSIFDDKELERERGVILQEIAMTNDTPDDIIFDYFQELAFQNNPLGYHILGPVKNIKKFQREDFINYMNAQYNYSNIAVVAAGAIKENDIVNYTKKYFNNLSITKKKEKKNAEYTGGEKRKYKNLEQVNLVLGFGGVNYEHRNYYSSHLLANILGGGMSSRLFQEVREKHGLAYSIYAFNMSYKDNGLFGIYAATSEDKVNSLLDLTTKEINNVISKVSEKELTRVKNQYKASLLMSKESTVSRSQKIGSQILNYGKIIPDKEIIDIIDNVTTTDIKNSAREIFSSTKPTFCAIGKIKNIYDYDKIAKLNEK